MGDDNDNVQPCSSLSPIAALLCYHIIEGMIFLTQEMHLACWAIDSHTQFNQVMRVNIPATRRSDGGDCQFMWFGPELDLLEASSNKSVWQIWNLGYDEDYLLEFNEKGKNNASRRPGMEEIVCIVYNLGSRACERTVEGMNGMTSITETGRGGGGGGSISPFIPVLYFPLYTCFA